MNTHRLPTTSALLREGISEGLHIGAQLHVTWGAEVAADVAVGESRPGVAMTPDTLMVWMSACKPIGAVAIAQLLEAGKLVLDDPVAKFLPAFGQNGKEPITLSQILMHTCGFRWLETGWPNASWDQIIEKICGMPLERGWVPGEKAGYHPATSWFILGEIVRRVDGRPYEQYVREMIFERLGMNDSWVGMPAERYHDYGERIGILHQTEKKPPTPAEHSDEEAALTSCRPGANGCGPVRELTRFYQMILNGGALDGAHIINPQSVDLFTARRRVGMFDQTFRHIMDWGLGFMVNSNRYGPQTVPYGYGPHASERTFGHGGAQSSTAFADPEHDLAIALVCNGMPGEAAHQPRMRRILAAIYEDLGLAYANRDS